MNIFFIVKSLTFNKMKKNSEFFLEKKGNDILKLKFSNIKINSLSYLIKKIQFFFLDLHFLLLYY